MKPPLFDDGGPDLDWGRTPTWRITIGATLLVLYAILRKLVDILMVAAGVAAILAFIWLAWIAIAVLLMTGFKSVIWILETL